MSAVNYLAYFPLTHCRRLVGLVRWACVECPRPATKLLPFEFLLSLIVFSGNLSARAGLTMQRVEALPELVSLATPEYPPLARTAHIMGEVEVTIKVGKDGSIESAEATGHPLLKPAVLASVQKSTFACIGCSEGGTLVLTYSFEMKDDGDCSSVVPRPAEVTQLQNRVTIVGFPSCCCDPAVTNVRSWKCLYLWRCGFRVL